MRIDVFVVINQTISTKQKYIIIARIPKIIIKEFYFANIKKIVFVKYKNDKSIIRRAKTNSKN